MQMQDLAKVYKTKTDEELLQLASDSERLTPEAHAILRSELAVRRIDVPKHLTAQEESDQGRSEQPRTRGTPFIRDSHAVREFVAEVVHVYHGQFWLFIKLIAPAVVVSYIAVVMARNEVREIERHLPRGVEVLKHETEILEIGLLNLAGYLVSWIGFCLELSQQFQIAFPLCASGWARSCAFVYFCSGCFLWRKQLPCCCLKAFSGYCITVSF